MKTRNVVIALGMVSGLTFLACSGEDGVDGVNGADGTSCYAKALKDSSGFELYCGDEYVGTLKNGEDGAKGDKGDDGAKGDPGDKGDTGAAGESCTAKEVSDGVVVSCGGEVIGVIKDGAKGDKGDKGADGAAGTSCTATKLEGDAGIEIKCGETVVDTVKNGAKGDKGDKGADGAAGTSCTATKLEGDAGIEIKCGETVVDTVKNGAKGDPGAAGTSCTAEEISGGVMITCTDGKTYTLNNGTDGKDGRNFDEDWMVDPRDRQLYKVVTIGEQTWMAHNLNYETDAGSYCYNDSVKYCKKYGRLYTWAAAMDSTGTWTTNGKGCGYGKTCTPTYPVRGVCPEGWHLPDTTEWKTLFDAVGGKGTAEIMLKSTEGWNDYGRTSGNGSDTYSFSALPAGGRGSNGFFYYEGSAADFWSSTEDDSNYAYDMNLDYSNDGAYLNYNYKGNGFSVRCLKD